MSERETFMRVGQDAFQRGMLGLAIMYNDIAIRKGVEMLDANVAKLSSERRAFFLKNYIAR